MPLLPSSLGVSSVYVICVYTSSGVNFVFSNGIKLHCVNPNIPPNTISDQMSELMPYIAKLPGGLV
jgi:hypothetical protein